MNNRDIPDMLYTSNGDYQYFGRAGRGASTATNSWQIIRFNTVTKELATSAENIKWTDVLTTAYSR
jgi:hypothetical protein